MRIKIRDWDSYFEADRSRQWKKLSWVPVPNKQGLGYKKIMSQKNGAAIFGCWNALIQQASLCLPRGDLTKYTIEDLSTKTDIPLPVLSEAINFIVQHLDWIEVIENLDINVKECHQTGQPQAVVSSMLCSSILSNSCSSMGGVEIPTHLSVVFSQYHEMRKKIKKPMTTAAVSMAIKKILSLSSDHDIQVKIVEQSIFNSWQGIFPLKETNTGRVIHEYERNTAGKYDDL